MKNVMMLIIGLFTLCVSVQNVNAQKANFKTGDVLYVYAYNGLNLRAEPSTNSRVVEKLDHADEVEVIQVMSESKEIDFRNSNWIEVDAYGKKGYLFGGYLSAVEPMYLDADSFDCDVELYYMDWVLDMLGDAAPVVKNAEMSPGSAWSTSKDETTIYTSYATGDMVYYKTGPDTDSYYFESLQLNYNDVLNFMEYLVACQNRFCPIDQDSDKSIFKPIKNIYGELVRVDCTAPLAITAQQKGTRMIVKMETCL